jgi:hypothetical protein
MSSFNEEISSNDEVGSDEEMVSNDEIDSEEYGSDIEIKSNEEFIGSDDEENYSEDGSRYESSVVESLYNSYWFNYLSHYKLMKIII